jgi:UrcA family protein
LRRNSAQKRDGKQSCWKFRREIMVKFITTVRNSLFIAAAVVASVPAFAGTLESAPTVKVVYSDLDLSSASGQRHLHNRLIGAARAVCEANIQSGSAVQPARNACRKQAMNSADTQFALLVGTSQPKVAAADTTGNPIAH